MSIDAVCWAWEKNNLAPLQKLLLVYLANAAGMDNIASGDICNLVYFLNVDFGKVDNALYALEKKKFIKIDHIAPDYIVHLVGYTPTY